MGITRRREISNQRTNMKKRHKHDYERVEFPPLDRPLYLIEIGIVLAFFTVIFACVVGIHGYFSQGNTKSLRLDDVPAIVAPRAITITDAAGKGSVVISLADGSIKLNNETIQRSGPVFWNAMEAAGYVPRPFQIPATKNTGPLEFRFDNGCEIKINGVTGVITPSPLGTSLDSVAFWVNLESARHFEPQEGYDPKPMLISTMPPVAKKQLRDHTNLRKEGDKNEIPKNKHATRMGAGDHHKSSEHPMGKLANGNLVERHTSNRLAICPEKLADPSRKFHPSRLGRENLVGHKSNGTDSSKEAKNEKAISQLGSNPRPHSFPLLILPPNHGRMKEIWARDEHNGTTLDQFPCETVKE